MAYKFYNPNPVGRFNIDCIPRATAKALDIDWDAASVLLCNAAIGMGTVECSDDAMAAVLRRHGFCRDVIPNTCPECYTVNDFCEDHPKGTFVLELGGHVVTIVDGVAYDTTNPARETVQFYWYQKE